MWKLNKGLIAVERLSRLVPNGVNDLSHQDLEHKQQILGEIAQLFKDGATTRCRPQS